MKPKKILAALFAAFFIMLFPSNANASMTVGILKDNAPYSTFYHRKARGLEPELARKMTDDSVIFKAYDTRKQLESALKKRRIQIAFGSIDAFNVNQDVFDVSEPYLYEPNVLFRRSDGKKKTIKKLANKPVGMLKDGNQTYLLKNVLLKPRSFKNIKTMDKALTDGKIYAATMTIRIILKITLNTSKPLMRQMMNKRQSFSSKSAIRPLPRRSLSQLRTKMKNF